MAQQNNVASNAAEFPSPPKSASPLLDEWGDSRMEDVAIWFLPNAGDAIMVVVNLEFPKRFWKIQHRAHWCVPLHPGAHIFPTLKLILSSYPSQNARPKSLPLHCGVYPPGGIPSSSCLIYLWFHWNRKQKNVGAPTHKSKVAEDFVNFHHIFQIGWNHPQVVHHGKCATPRRILWLYC